MSGNVQKTPQAKALNEFSAARNADSAHIQGKRLPCHVVKVEGAIVTVAFDVNAAPFTLSQVRMPIANSIYVREPTQVGDKGYAAAADARLGGVSGLGTGTPDLSLPSNLGALVFVPLGNANWAAAPDPNKLLLQGPKGFYVRDLPSGSDPETFSIVGDKDAKTITTRVGDNVTLVVDDENITATGHTRVELVVNATSVVVEDGTVTISAGTEIEIEVGAVSVVVDGSSVTVTGTSGVTLSAGGNTLTTNASGVTSSGDMTVGGNLSVDGNLIVDGTTSLGGGAQAIKLADGSNSTTVTAT